MFPVAVRLFHFPPTYDMSDVYSFAKEFGRVERVTKLSEMSKILWIYNESALLLSAHPSMSVSP